MLLLLSLVGGCIAADPSHDEVARSTSPDGTIDAVVIESNGGATTSFSYDVCLARRGGDCNVEASVANLYGASRSDQAYGINIRWADASLIRIEYLDAERAEVLRPTTAIGGRTVNAVLRSGVNDPSAPPGGMLYNLAATTASGR
ncbi:DUF5412 domain-containing protein [Lysobacter sp. MMG2]|uniref:DUF5412 domain-containing protein n=1 Tax=Lysobacter sp. MMG2 TaxID=2801338 RepID=UPI001C2141BC|nr:DUF5412 domain-containing protein [Lysobacter sp. MMG2]MBU8978026.1 DUF5412 domain-containing protein [Lysobacter sp. MMG2]